MIYARDHRLRVLALLLCSSLAAAQQLDLPAKASWYVHHTFSPGALLIPALPAAIIMADPPRHYPREWRSGGAAFGRNLGDGLATQVSANTARFLVGAAVHEDPRYFSDTRTEWWHRSLHALAFTLVDKSDTGQRMPALSNYAGALSAGFVGRVYLPDGFNDTVHAGQRSAGALTGYLPTLVVGYATGNLASEFSPELKRLGRKLHLPFVPK